MANHVPASFLTQANALFRKNLTYQVWPNYTCNLSIYTHLDDHDKSIGVETEHMEQCSAHRDPLVPLRGSSRHSSSVQYTG